MMYTEGNPLSLLWIPFGRRLSDCDTVVLKAGLRSLLFHSLSLKDLCTSHCADAVQMHSRSSFRQAPQISGGRRERHRGKAQNEFNFSLLWASYQPLSCFLCMKTLQVAMKKV